MEAAADEGAQAALRVAVSRIRGAEDIDAVRGALLDAAAALPPTPPAAGQQALFARFLDTLLADVLPEWAPCMSTHQRQRCFDVWFDGSFVPLHHVLLALGRALGAAADAGVVELIGRVLWGAGGPAAETPSGLARVLALVESELAAGGGPACDAVLGLVVSLPERVANALKLAAPRWCRPEPYHAAVADAMWLHFVRPAGAPPRRGGVLPALLARQARLRQVGMIMQLWVARLLATPTLVGAMRAVAEALPEPAFEQVLRAMLDHMPPFEAGPARSPARRLLCELVAGGLVGPKPPWRYLLSQKLPIDSALARTVAARHSVRYVIDCLLRADEAAGEDGGESMTLPLVEQTVGSIVNVWTEPDFTQHSTIEYHRHLTHVMLHCLERMQEHAAAAHVQQRLEQSGWIGELMHGVQSRFDSPIPTVRMLGMIVAERLSELISPAKPLRFDEVAAAKALLGGDGTRQISNDEALDIDYFGASGPQIDSAPEEQAVASHDPDAAEGFGEDRHAGGAAAYDDPDALLAPPHDGDSSSDSSESASDDEDDEESVASLEPYALPEASHARGHRPPKHVREILAWLRLPKDPTPKDYDRYEAALRNIESLLYAGGAVAREALQDEATELITVLIHLQDSLVDDPNDDGATFAELRHSALVATVIHAPRHACLHLASTVFSENCSIATRVECMRVLGDGCMQLAHPSRRKGQQPTAAAAPAALDQPGPGDAARREPPSRRWGHTARAARQEQRKEPTPQRNEFSELAGPVLFTLLAEYDKRGGTADYLRTEPAFVTKLLNCCGVVFEAAGHAPGLPRMAERLGEFCWHMRHHSEASVRRAVLLLFAQLIMAVDLGGATAHGGEAGEWLREVAADDADKMCREIAKTCLSPG